MRSGILKIEVYDKVGKSAMSVLSERDFFVNHEGFRNKGLEK